MTTDRDFDRIAMAWLADGPDELSDRVLDAVVDEIHVTRQRHSLRLPWRFPTMNTPARVAAAAAIGVLAIGGALYVMSPGRSSVGGPGPTPTPTASPTPSPSPAALHEGPLTAGTYTWTPFSQPGSDACYAPPQPGCIDSTNDDAIRVAVTVPDGWTGGGDGVSSTDADPASAGGAQLFFVRGAMLFDDPCRNTDPPTIPVGPTVDDFANALALHPLLDVTTPTSVSLAGYAGKYVDLQVPSDLTGCAVYRPWEPWYYAQGPGERWHLWILDVDGVRVVVQSIDHAETSAQYRAELQQIVDSVQIQP